MKSPKNNKATDKYKCPSYYDDDNILRDCTCGKCEAPTPSLSEGEGRIAYSPEIIKVRAVLAQHFNEWSADLLEDLAQLLSQTRKEDRERMVAIGEDLIAIFEGVELGDNDKTYINAIKDYQSNIRLSKPPNHEN